MTLGEALPLEQARVRKLIVMYNDPELNGAGRLAAAMMESSLREADRAVMEQDIPAMIRSLEDLEGYSD